MNVKLDYKLVILGIFLLGLLLIAGGEWTSVGQVVTSTVESNDLRITTYPSEVDIYLDDQYKGKTSESGTMLVSNLPEGIYLIRAAKEGYADYSVNKFLTWSQSFLPITLTKISTEGSLFVDSNPVKASIYVDGVFKGEAGEIITDISVGVHQIKVVLYGYEEFRATKYIESGQQNSIEVSLSKK
ncbi:MAG TPA: PEGA domain-containing protein [Candidatus Nanoarchaeia archaeon]|nr:PEGA domain-containing protein [Candidatus Nanoarchaeia archaeon]